MNKSITVGALIAIIIGVLVALHISSLDAPVSSVDIVVTDPVDVTQPGDVDLAPAEPADDYVGLSETAAAERALTLNESFRVIERDGEPLPITEDYRPGRINAVVEAGVVTSYVVEGSEFLDRIEITLPGPDHFTGLHDVHGIDGDSITRVGDNGRRFTVNAWEQYGEEYFEDEGETKHEWTISIVRSDI